MTDNKNTILAIVLSAVVLIAWQYFYGMPQQKARQEALKAAIGSWGHWAGWDREARRIAFEDDVGTRRTLPAEVLGSFAPPESSWCWAWANGSFTPRESQASAGLRSAAPESLPLLERGGFPCDPPFAYTVAMVGGHVLGERAVFRYEIPRTGVQLFFAVEMPASGD